MLYRISQILLEIAIRICTRVSILGRENIPDKGPYVIISNHSSILDPPLIGMAFRKVTVNFLAKKELFASSLLGCWIRNINMVCIDREIGASGMKDALKRLKDGRVLGIFPEGTRAMEGESVEAKKGIGFIVARSRVSVIPVYIEGSGKALPKGGRVVFGVEIKVHVGKNVTADEPFMKTAIKNKDYEGITSFLMARMKEEKV